MFIWILVIVGLVLLYHLWNRNQIFRRMGIEGMNPKLLFGDLPSFDFEKINIMAQMNTREAVKKSKSKTVGFMYGGSPMLVTADLDILNDVFNKKFDYFSARPRIPLGPSNNKSIDLFQSKGSEWKRQRAIINRCFATGNIKNVFPMISSRSDVLVERLRNCEGPVDGNDYFYKYTLDVIAKIIFDDHENYQKDEVGVYESFLKLVFVFSPWLRLVSMCLPELANVWHYANRAKITLLSGRSVMQLLNRITATIVEHKEEGVGKHDFVQFMLEAELDETDGDMTKLGSHLTQSEIVRNALVILFAGSDTTAVSLAYVCVLLAVHPDDQAAIHEEVFSVCGRHETITYEMLDKLPLLEGALRETLRLYPQSTGVVNRMCVKTCTVGKPPNQVTIPEGMLIQADTWTLHRDTVSWGNDSLQFRPTRWTDGNPVKHPMQFMAFGGGRRLCVGQRLAFIELKSTMAKILREFEITTCDKTIYPFVLRGTASPEPKDAFVTMTVRA